MFFYLKAFLNFDFIFVNITGHKQEGERVEMPSLRVIKTYLSPSGEVSNK